MKPKFKRSWSLIYSHNILKTLLKAVILIISVKTLGEKLVGCGNRLKHFTTSHSDLGLIWVILLYWSIRHASSAQALHCSECSEKLHCSVVKWCKTMQCSAYNACIVMKCSAVKKCIECSDAMRHCQRPASCSCKLPNHTLWNQPT